MRIYQLLQQLFLVKASLLMKSVVTVMLAIPPKKDFWRFALLSSFILLLERVCVRDLVVATRRGSFCQ